MAQGEQELQYVNLELTNLKFLVPKYIFQYLKTSILSLHENRYQGKLVQCTWLKKVSYLFV